MLELRNLNNHSKCRTKQYVIICLLLSFVISNIKAQFDGQVWFVGDQAANSGIVFPSANDQPYPSNLKGLINLSESSVMLENPAMMLFYSNGNTILNAIGKPMPNAETLKGSEKSMYGSSLVDNPAACDQYYLFYTESSDQLSNSRLYYSLIDMTIEVEDSIFTHIGDVIPQQKDIDITPSGVDIGESLYAISKPIPKEGAWLFASDRKNSSILIFNIDSKGISLHKEYKLSQINSDFSTTPFTTIKFDSHYFENGSTLLTFVPSSEEGDRGFTIGGVDFNTQNGTITDESYIEIAKSTNSVYGTAFSADGSKFYYSDHIDKTLHQFDFNTQTTYLIGTSSHNGKSGGLKRAINNDIYWASKFSINGSESEIGTLSVIENPDEPGLACNLNIGAYKLGTTALATTIGVFPFIVSEVLDPKPVLIDEASCGRNNGSARILVDPKLEPLTYNWSSGSTEKELTDVSIGNYLVEAISLDGCIYIDSIEVTESINFSIANITVSFLDPSDCNAEDGKIIISSPDLIKDDLFEIAYSFNDKNHFTTLAEVNENEQLIISDLPVGFYNGLSLLSSNQGCSISIADEASLLGNGDIPNIGSDTTICQGVSYEIQAGSIYSNYLWSDGSTDKAITVDKTGTYSLEVTNENGCISSNSVYVKFADQPTVSLDRVLELDFGDSISLSPKVNSNDTLSYLWSPPEGLSCIRCISPTAQPLSNKKYFLEVINDSNCKGTASVIINIKNKSGLYFPNSFSPNGDGHNDLFEFSISSDAVDLIKSFAIFNRWGESTYLKQNIERGDVNFGWNGNLNGAPVENGVYVYTAEVLLLNGQTVNVRGDVLIIR